MSRSGRRKIRKGLLVEMVGLPGSGKSSLCHRVNYILNQRGIPTNYRTCSSAGTKGRLFEKLRKSVSIIPFVLTNLGYIFRSARIILSRKDREETYTPAFLQGWIYMSYLYWYHRSSRGVNLFCQALLQLLWSFGFTSKEGYLLNLPASFLRSIFTPDMVIVLEADLATIKRRMDNRLRSDSWTKKWGFHEPSSLSKSSNVFDDVKKILVDINQPFHNMQVMIVDNNLDSNLETNALKIADAIEQLWNRKVVNAV